MTEAEIMKALECCCDRNITKCIKECPLKDFDGECYSAMKQDILDLINRKNAEIEKMKLFEEKRKEIVLSREEAEKALKERSE